MKMIVWSKIEGQPTTPWLWARAPDILLVAGGGSLLFAATMVPLTLAFPALAPALAAAFLHLAALCNFPHYAATYQLVVRERRTMTRTYGRLLLSTPVMLGALAAGVVWPALITPIVRVYLTWSAYHYAAQHFGIASMYAARQGRPLADGEKRPMYVGFVGVAAFMMLSTNMAGTGSANPFGARAAEEPFFLLPADTYYVALGAVVLGFASFVVGHLRAARRTGRGFGAIAWLLFVTNAAWFVLPFLRTSSGGGPWMGGTLALWVPYAIPFFHCAQYLVVTTWRARTTGPVKPTLLFLLLAGVGLALFEGVTRAVSSFALLTEDNAYLLVPAVLNIHHFWVDGMMWKRPKKSPRAAGAAPASFASAEKIATR